MMSSHHDHSHVALLANLTEALGAKPVVTDPEVLESYRWDRAQFCDAGMPLALLFPTSTNDVSEILRIATAHHVPVVTQGARSGLSGAANAIDNSLILSLERMTQIKRIDRDNRIVVTQPGVMNAELSRAVAAEGLFYPPDPSSSQFCTIGGNIATNAGGLCCVKYGVTRDYVLELEVVLATGEVVRLGRRTAKGVAGLDLVGLFVGSEGTLGVITEATLALKPLPADPHTVAATFETTAHAATAVSNILSAGITPSLLEFMDRASINAVNQALSMGFEETGALVFAQSDAPEVAATEEIRRLAELLHAAGATQVLVAESRAEAELLMAARREVLPAFERLGTTLIDDVCVPRDSLSALVTNIEDIASKQSVIIGLVGHAGDGNFHPIVVFDQKNADESARAQQAFEQVMSAALQLGGTITGEHGVGILKREMLRQELSNVALRIHRDIKAALDPMGIMNPGKVVNS